jgi:hypothetical protein
MQLLCGPLPTMFKMHPLCYVVQSRTIKLDKFHSSSHSSFWIFLTIPLCPELQNTLKTALWGFSHEFLGVANFFGLEFPDLGTLAGVSVQRCNPSLTLPWSASPILILPWSKYTLDS